jgi:hypothetical protein
MPRLIVLLLAVCAGVAWAQDEPPAAAPRDWLAPLYQDHLYLAVPDLADWLGATVDLDQATGETSVAWQGHSLTFGPNRTEAQVDGRGVKLDGPTLDAGVALAPARFLAEGLGFKLTWEAAAGSSTISDGQRQMRLRPTSQITTLSATWPGDKQPTTIYHLSLRAANAGARVDPPARVWLVRGGRNLASFTPSAPAQPTAGGLRLVDADGSGRPAILASWHSPEAKEAWTVAFILGWRDEALTNLVAAQNGLLAVRAPGQMELAAGSKGQPAKVTVWTPLPAQAGDGGKQLYWAGFYGWQDKAVRLVESRQTEQPYAAADQQKALIELGLRPAPAAGGEAKPKS